MTTTTINPYNPYPNVPLPAFATFADDWQTSGPELPYRIVTGPDRAVAGTEVVVYVAATQYADGRIGELEIMYVNLGRGNSLTTDGARALTAMLL